MAVNEHDGDEKDALLSRLYREAAREEPPAHLDRAIAAAAREGMGRRSSPASSRLRSWWTPWRLPFAFAALAVVSVSLVTLMMEEDAERVASVPASPPPAAQEREAASVAQPPVEAPESTTSQKDAEARRAQRQDARKVGPAFVPEPPATSSSRGELARTEPIAPPAEAGPRSLQKAPASEAPPPAQDALAAGAASARSEVQARRSEDRTAAAPAPAPAAEAAPAPPAAQAPAARPAPPQPAAKPAPPPKASIGIRGMQRDGYAMPAQPSPEVARHIAELEGKPPSAWIERALTLRREARTVEAEGLLAEIRRRFPNEPLPAELQ